MTTIFYCVACFAAGFAIAYFIKGRSRFVSSDTNSETISKIASLEAEKNIALNNLAQLHGQIENLQAQLRIVSAESAEKNARIEAETEHKQHLNEENRKLEQKLAEASNTINSLDRQKSYADAELKYKNELLETQKSEIEQLGNKFEAQFKVLAQNILEEKTKTFDQHQQTSLEQTLKPLKESITVFKAEIEAKYNTENAERISLKEQIKLIAETNKLLSEQADNLTTALKGQVKQQGNWGEMILESILEHSGLTKDIHFFVQERIVTDEGQAFLPDVIVKYPDGRSIIIDSKVSLKNYTEYCSCKDVVQQEQCLQLLIKSIYSHTDNLSSKDYQQKANALDFVMLFIPVEGAYITAMQGDVDIWRYAYNKKVLLISPTNLIAAMKLVYDLWKKDAIGTNANTIAEKAVKIYEKLAAFIEDFEKIGSQLNKASGIFTEAQKKLYKGKGNLLSQANQMKSKLKHNKPARELPPHLLEQALAEEEQEEQDINKTGES